MTYHASDKVWTGRQMGEDAWRMRGCEDGGGFRLGRGEMRGISEIPGSCAQQSVLR